jgi:outer membrane protein TolC
VTQATAVPPAHRRLALVAGLLAAGAAPARADLLDRVLRQAAGGAGAGAAPPVGPTSPASTVSPAGAGGLAGPLEATDLATLIGVAVRTSPALARAAIDRDLARAQAAAARALDDWRLQANLDVSSSGGRVAGITIERQTEVTLGGTLLRALPTGGTVSLHAEGTLSDVDAATVGGRDWEERLGLTLAHPLLRGRGRAVARADVGRARLAADAAELAARREAIGAVQQVVAAYWDLVFAQREHEIRLGSLELARERLRRTQAALAAGSVALAETVEIEQVVVTREEAALAAELTVLDRSLALRGVVGLAIAAGQLGLTVVQPLDLPARQYDLAASLAAARSSSPELAELAVSDAQAAIDVEVAESGLLPALDATLSLGPRGRGETLGEASRNLVTVDDVVVVGRLSLEHDLGQRAARAGRDTAQLRRARTRLGAIDVERQLALAVASTSTALEAGRQRAALAEQTIALARRNIGIEQTRYALGKSTNFDVLTRQDELREAELRLARIVVDWHKAEAALRALTGDLLRDFAIDVRAATTAPALKPPAAGR